MCVLTCGCWWCVHVLWLCVLTCGCWWCVHVLWLCVLTCGCWWCVHVLWLMLAVVYMQPLVPCCVYPTVTDWTLQGSDLTALLLPPSPHGRMQQMPWNMMFYMIQDRYILNSSIGQVKILWNMMFYMIQGRYILSSSIGQVKILWNISGNKDLTKKAIRLNWLNHIMQLWRRELIRSSVYNLPYIDGSEVHI